MTPMQRFLTTLSHQEPDQVPLFLLFTMQGAKELGMPIKQYFSQADYAVEGQQRLRDKYDNDCYYTFQYAAVDVEPWGGKVVFIEDGPPNAGKPIIKSPSQIMDMNAPDPCNSTSTTRVLDVIRKLKANSNGEVPIIGCVMSPFSLPVMQMGFDKYIELIYEHPEQFERLMSINEEYCVNWANAQLEAGATAVVYFDPVSSATITPPQLSAKTGFPIARRTIARFKGPAMIHFAAGRCFPLLGELMTAGVPAIGVSVLEELSALKKACKGKLTLVGSLNGIEMRRWTLAEAQQITKHQIAQAGEGGGFILSDNHGEIPWQVSDEVLLEISKTVKTWGHYPLSWLPSHLKLADTASTKNPAVSFQKQLADYAMAFDLFGSLGELTSKSNAIERILEFYEILTGAGLIAYLPSNGEPSSLQSIGANTPDRNALHSRIAAFTGPYRLLESGKGFYFEISDSGERYGTMLVDKITPPETSTHYLNLSVNLARVFALAISNAQKLEILSQSQAELKMHREKLTEQVEKKARELKATHEQLLHSEKLSALGRLTGSIAHEFNNPIFGLRNIAEQTLEHLSDDEDFKPLLTLAIKECDRMASLVKKLQGFYKPSQEPARSLDIHPIMDDVLLLIKKELQVRKIRLEKNYCAGIPNIFAEEDKLKQVFLNIISNALDAMQQGGVINVTTQADSNNIQISIKDTGEGISQDKLNLIFEPFYTTKASKGTGLGLYISYEIIKAYGGNINVQSTLGEGTTFTINLPAVKGLPPK